jgi:hypothetical protein
VCVCVYCTHLEYVCVCVCVCVVCGVWCVVCGVCVLHTPRCTVTNAVPPGEAEFGLLPTFGGGGRDSPLATSRPCIDARYGMRLSVSYYETPDIEEGVRRLAVALDAYLLRLRS